MWIAPRALHLERHLNLKVFHNPGMRAVMPPPFDRTSTSPSSRGVGPGGAAVLDVRRSRAKGYSASEETKPASATAAVLDQDAMKTSVGALISTNMCAGSVAL